MRQVSCSRQYMVLGPKGQGRTNLHESLFSRVLTNDQIVLRRYILKDATRKKSLQTYD